MTHSPRRWRMPVRAFVLALTLVLLAPAGKADAAVDEYGGTLDNGTIWAASVPDNWNGTLLLYSHGYRPSFAPIPLIASVAPNDPTADALLEQGYALVGSSYAANGWALTTAVDDQLASLDEALAAIGTEPDRILAYGTSMGGLVTGRIAEHAGHIIEGAMPTCGLMAGGVDLNNFQLDAAHAINELLAPGVDITFSGYADLGEAFAATGALTTAVVDGQLSPEGRARVALAAALHHVPDWEIGAAEPPAPRDHEARQEAMYNWLVTTLGFVTPARWDLEVAAGGNATWNVGVDYRRLFQASEDRATVKAMYDAAGLDLEADLDTLTATADIAPDPGSLEAMNAHSELTGALKMPVLTMHTTDDNLAPVQFEEEYSEDVRSHGDRGLLRQTTVARPGHCTFTPAEIVTGVKVLEQRVITGHWDGTAQSAKKLNALAASVNAGGSAFVHHVPQEFLGDRTLP